MSFPVKTLYSFQLDDQYLTIWNDENGAFLLTSTHESWGTHASPELAAKHAALVLREEDAPSELVEKVGDLSNWQPGTQRVRG